MDVQSCPHCGIRVLPSAEGTCPSCRQSVLDVLAAPQASPGPTESNLEPVNPYGSPGAVPPAPSPAIKAKEPFSKQAAKFSAYAPFILLLLGFCVQGQLKAHEGTQSGFQLAVALGGLSFLTTLAAFVLGFVGLAGGIARRSFLTIALALAGILLNGALLAVWSTVLVGIFGQNP